MGLRPESPVRVLAVTGPDPGAAVAGLAAFGHAPVDGGYAVLVRGGTPADSIRPPHRSRIGIGLDGARRRGLAVVAPGAGRRPVRRRVRDRRPAARGVIATLHAICVHDSIRHAATAMHLHHSSVVARLERAEDELGFSVRSPGGRTRLVLALTLRHLR